MQHITLTSEEQLNSFIYESPWIYIYAVLICLRHTALYRVAHKKWIISFDCLQCVYHTHTENFYSISMVPKTLIRMFTVRCSN